MQASPIAEHTAFIRHSPCHDGTCAALPFWLSLPESQRRRLGELLGEADDAGKAPSETASALHAAAAEGLPLFIRARPGDSPPQGLLGGYTVYLLDFCYAGSELETLAGEVGPTGRIVVLDHHASNERTVADFAVRHPDLVEAVFDAERSGAQIAWDYARDVLNFDLPPRSETRVIDYVGDRDLWRFALPKSREINAAFWAKKSFATLDTARTTLEHAQHSANWQDELAMYGSGVLQREDGIIAQIVAAAKTAYVTVRDAQSGELTEYTVRVVNSPVLPSEIGARLVQAESDQGAHFGAIWHYDHGADETRVSLRARRPDVDLSKIAGAIVGVIGGGGHPAAAGCAFKGSDINAVFRPQP